MKQVIKLWLFVPLSLADDHIPICEHQADDKGVGLFQGIAAEGAGMGGRKRAMTGQI